MTFDETLDKHLRAIETKDIDAFLETVPTTGDLTLVLLNGKRMDTAEEFIALNRDWFADEDWSAKMTVIRKVSGADLGFALVEVDYHDVDRDGQPLHKTYYLNLIFQRQADGRWLLTHDQNSSKSSA